MLELLLIRLQAYARNFIKSDSSTDIILWGFTQMFYKIFKDGLSGRTIFLLF